MGFLPLFITRCNSTYQYSYITDHGPRVLAHGTRTRDQMRLNCVPIVARLRQNLGVARCRDCSFNAKKVSRWVSRFASKCRDLCQSVAGRLESFYYRANIGSKVRQYVHNRDTSRHFFSIRDSIATPKVSRCFA